MIGYLYRYPHPENPARFIYVGQGAKRDQQHWSGKSSFGRKFKQDFSGMDLPQPTREEVEVVDRQHLNSMETAWMVLYRTLYSMGGMNQQFPGSADYKSIGLIAGRKHVESGHIQNLGRIYGRKSVENGRLASIRTSDSCSKGGKISGKQNAENGHLDRIRPSVEESRAQLAKIRTPEHQRKAGQAAGYQNVESGQIQRLGKEYGPQNGKANGLKNIETGHIIALGKKQGPISGRLNVESGRLAGYRTKEHQSAASKSANHCRWHVKRGIVSSTCSLCREVV